MFVALFFQEQDAFEQLYQANNMFANISNAILNCVKYDNSQEKSVMDLSNNFSLFVPAAPEQVGNCRYLHRITCTPISEVFLRIDWYTKKYFSCVICNPKFYANLIVLYAAHSEQNSIL